MSSKVTYQTDLDDVDWGKIKSALAAVRRPTRHGPLAESLTRVVRTPWT